MNTLIESKREISCIFENKKISQYLSSYLFHVVGNLLVMHFKFQSEDAAGGEYNLSNISNYYQHTATRLAKYLDLRPTEFVDSENFQDAIYLFSIALSYYESYTDSKDILLDTLIRMETGCSKEELEIYKQNSQLPIKNDLVKNISNLKNLLQKRSKLQNLDFVTGTLVSAIGMATTLNFVSFLAPVIALPVVYGSFKLGVNIGDKLSKILEPKLNHQDFKVTQMDFLQKVNNINPSPNKPKFREKEVSKQIDLSLIEQLKSLSIQEVEPVPYNPMNRKKDSKSRGI